MSSDQVPHKAKILLLSGYDAASHKHWRNILEKNITEYDWTQIALPDRHFYWRVRGNSLSFAYQHREVLNQHFDCLIVTSMVDLSALRGLLPKIATIPTLIYFHENQFAYPLTKNSNTNNSLIHAQLSSIYSLLCADRILFNSEHNKQTFFDGADKLLSKMPDLVPKNLLRKSLSKSKVVSVPIEREFFVGAAGNLNTSENTDSKIQILWNHRWEFDKQPEVFFSALGRLKNEEFDFELNIIGQTFRQSPDCFELAKEEFENEIVNWGFQQRSDYHKILQRSDIVVSSALHDFQGLSMLEAIASGCIPVAPNRVAYPEYIAKEQLYEVSQSELESNAEKSIAHETEQLFFKLKDTLEMIKWDSNNDQEKKGKASYNRGVNPTINLSQYGEAFLSDVYRTEIRKLISDDKNSYSESKK